MTITYTEQEREDARACGCKSCQQKYDLPPKEAPAGSASEAVLGVAVLAALGFGVYSFAKMFAPKAAPAPVVGK